MKKYILLLGLALMFSLASAGNSCTPSSGYTKCWEHTNDNYLPALSYAKAELGSYTDDAPGNGYWTEGYAIGSVRFDYKCTGDKCYLYENSEKWDNTPDCTSSGCPSPFKGVSKTGTVNVAKLGNMIPSSYCNSVKAWDYDSESGWWSWATAGYRICLPNTKIKVVVCYKDIDCGTEMYCDKSGDWKTWSCKSKECETGEEKCEGSEYWLCEEYNWINKGITKGKCDVQCTSDSDCGSMSSSLYCSERNLMIKTKENKCINNLCEVKIQDRIKQRCDYWCRNKKCIERPPQECGNNKIEGSEECEADTDCESGFECVSCYCVEKAEEGFFETIKNSFGKIILWFKGMFDL